MRTSRMCSYFTIAAVALCVCACARKTIVLQNRFAKGEERRYKMTMKGSGTTSISGLPGQKSGDETPVKLKVALAYRMLVKNVDAGGTADIETYFENFTSTTESGTLRIRMEADEKGARIVQGETVVKDAPGLESLKALFKNPTMVKMDKRGNVLSVVFPKGIAELLPHMNLSSLFKQNQFVLPEGPVAVGGSWNDKREITLGGGIEERLPGAKAITLDTKYTLAGFARKNGRSFADISLRGESAIRNMTMDLPQGQSPDVSMKATFDHLLQTVAGNILFDHQKGLMVGGHVITDQDLAMTMSMTKGGTNTKFRTATKIKMETDLNLIE